MRSRLRSGLELLLGVRTGVWERGERMREVAVSARPRVTEGSREGTLGPSIGYEGDPVGGRLCASGDGAAARRGRGQPGTAKQTRGRGTMELSSPAGRPGALERRLAADGLLRF